MRWVDDVHGWGGGGGGLLETLVLPKGKDMSSRIVHMASQHAVHAVRVHQQARGKMVGEREVCLGITFGTVVYESVHGTL